MEPINFEEIKASKKVKKLIADLQERLLLTEDALEDITRAAEIVEVTGQREILSTWIEQSNEFLKNRIVRPDSSISADEQKILVVTDETASNKNVT
jgi:dsDNA-binding SOS-regulon protein